ncbi:MAG: DUF6113 family protein [Microbacterium sp.]|uniref:DUF6113 family protein n=1 Tax=Microbacterium sp. TaxID=51671 RepID=UPI002604B7CF|nr:DUF6113 family protein [Microbacterium sp.]MCX6502436.1 DUF6113 family protein [Microbacterium sp.]
MGNRIGAWIVALLVGLVYGAAGAIAHASVWLGLPVGLVLAVIGSAALIIAMRLLTGDRWAGLAGGLGMIAATYVLSQTSPGGSILFTQAHEVAAVIWMAAVPLVTAVVVAWPDLRRLGSAASAPR